MRRRRWLAIVWIAMLVVPWTASAHPLLPLPMLPGVLQMQGDFSTTCGFSHRLSDDPIVAPKVPGGSHSHDFFGNRSTNAFSTYASLRAADTLCHRPLDGAAYWVPTLMKFGKALKPNGAVAYYFPGAKSGTSVKPYPAGLRMIAGNGKATSAQSTGVTSWSCSESSTRSSEPPLCAPGHWLRLHVRFPDCWNGKTLDSIDHKSHMAYSGGGCPASHPAGVPLLSLTISYPTSGGSGITHSSGSRYTGHGDFINAWDQAELARLVKECLNRGITCGGR